MRSMVLTGIRQMSQTTAPDPTLSGETDVLIRIRRVGVCGSDVHYYAEGRIGSQVVEYPYAVGHECAGVVEQVGTGVSRVKVGDKVAIDPAMSCFACDQCRCGRLHTCRNLRFLGCPGQADGCLGDLLVMPETSCFPIPDSMSLDDAALAEPLSIGVYAVRLAAMPPQAKIAILGAGPIGLSVLLPARVYGASKVYMTDRIDERLAVAKACGADWTGNVTTEDIVEQINTAEPDQMDVVYECCGQQDALDQAIEILKPGGKLMLIGIPSVDRVSFSIDNLRRKEICIQNVRRQNECVQEALDMIAEGEVDVSPMLTHHYSFGQSKDAFDLVDTYQDGVVKAMVCLDD